VQFFLFAGVDSNSYNAPRSEGIPLDTGRLIRVHGTYSTINLNLSIGIEDEKVCC